MFRWSGYSSHLSIASLSPSSFAVAVLGYAILQFPTSDFIRPLKQPILGMYHRILAPQKRCLDSAIIGDNCGVCFAKKVGQVVS